MKPADLTLELAIALLALIRCDDFGGGNEQRISASSLMSVPFAPRGRYAETLIEKLGKAAILGFSPASY